MDINTFFEKWQGQIETNYAPFIRRSKLIDMYNDLKKLVSAQEALSKAARDFIDIDDEIHSAPEGEEWKVIETRAKIYTHRRRILLLAMNPPNKHIEPTTKERGGSCLALVLKEGYPCFLKM